MLSYLPEMDSPTLARIIAAIGESDFPAIAAEALRMLLDFDLTAALAHPTKSRPIILFDNFAAAGARKGIETYARLTYTVNPMLAHARFTSVCRASDYAVSRTDLARMDACMRSSIVASECEELGFRTVGWPARLEEVDLYLDIGGSIVELGFYRERGRRPVCADKLSSLRRMSEPITAAFARHFALSRKTHSARAKLSAREREVCDLLLLGCSSQAIALRLGISRHTVKDHRKHIFRKLAIGSLAELFALHAAPN